MLFVPPPRWLPNPPVLNPWSDAFNPLGSQTVSAPTSAAWGTAPGKIYLIPFAIPEPFVVSKAYWLNGATVGTNSIDLGVYAMTDQATGRCDLLRSTGEVLSAGSANVVQETATFRVATTHITHGADSTDGTGFATASITLKAGRLYLLSVVNTAASAAVVSSITNGPTWSSRASTQFNGTAHRVSIWSGVPTVDYTGTLTINYGATQTGAKWSIEEFSGVDTATTDGVVQGVTGTGNSTTPLATLAAFGSANNATYGCHANTADSTTTPGAGFTELSDDTTAVTPAQFLQTEWRVDNDTTVDGTITSGQWGSCAVEIKADASTFTIPPTMPGNPNLYMAMSISGGTATVFAGVPGLNRGPFRGALQALVSPLPSTLTAAVPATNMRIPLAGFSSRTLIG